MACTQMLEVKKRKVNQLRKCFRDSVGIGDGSDVGSEEEKSIK